MDDTSLRSSLIRRIKPLHVPLTISEETPLYEALIYVLGEVSLKLCRPDYSYTQFDLRDSRTLPRCVKAWSARKDGLLGVTHLSLTSTCSCQTRPEFRPEFLRVDSAGVILELVIGEANAQRRRKPNPSGSPGEQGHWDSFWAFIAAVVLIAHAILAALVLITNCLLRKKRARFKGYPPGCRGSGGVMPWSIPVALAVLWGVCWMFYSPQAGDRSDPAIDAELDLWDPTWPSLPADNGDFPRDLDFSMSALSGNFLWEGRSMPPGVQDTVVSLPSALNPSMLLEGITETSNGDWSPGMDQVAPGGTGRLGASGQVHGSPRPASLYIQEAGTMVAEAAATDLAYVLDRGKGVSAQSRQQDAVAASGSMPGLTSRTYNKPSRSPNNLTTHKEKVHSNKRPFPCTVPFCGKGFRRKDNLKRHRETVHKHLNLTGSQAPPPSSSENSNQATTQQPAVEQLDAASQPSRIDVPSRTREELPRGLRMERELEELKARVEMERELRLRTERELQMERELRACVERERDEFKALHERSEKRADDRERMHEEREKLWKKLWEERERMYEKCLEK